jgi:tetratricopeptide (TPR) repeat protein
VGERWEREVEDPEEAAGLLSLHFHRAADYAKALRYASIAGAHAASIYANVEASRFYARAYESGRKAGAPASQLRDLAASWGDALRSASLFQEARRAYADALALSTEEEPVARAELMRKRSLVEENVGRLPQALRWLSKGRKQLDGWADRRAREELAKLDARYAAVLQAEGRNRDAIMAAERAIDAAEAVGSKAAQADARNILGVAYTLLGRAGAEEQWQAALQLYERLDDEGGQGNILINLGAGAFFEGRWTEALGFYERAREAYERIGDPSSVGTARENIAEILADQGRFDEAEALLRETTRVWRAAEDHYSLGFCLAQLGKVAGRQGRTDDALALFAQAREELLFVGAQGDVLDVDAREAECLLLAGRPAEALALADATLAQEEPGGALVPVLERVRGYALVSTGDLEGADAALAASLEASRGRGADHETAFTLQAVARLAVLRGAQPDPQAVGGSGEILSALGIIAVPAFPLSISA